MQSVKQIVTNLLIIFAKRFFVNTETYDTKA